MTASPTLMQTRGDIKARGPRFVLTRSARNKTLVDHPRWPVLPILASGGAKMPENPGEPSCIVLLGSWYSKATGLVASHLPSDGRAQAWVLDFFEPY